MQYAAKPDQYTRGTTEFCDRLDIIRAGIKDYLLRKKRERSKGYRPDITPHLMLDGGANVGNYTEPNLIFTYDEPKHLNTMGGDVSIDTGALLEFASTTLQGTHNPWAENIGALIDIDEQAGFDYIQSARGFGFPDSEGGWLLSPQGKAYKCLEHDRLKFLTKTDLIELMKRLLSISLTTH